MHVNNSRRRPDEAQLAQYASQVPPSGQGSKPAAKGGKEKPPPKEKKGEAAAATEELATEQDDEPEPLDFTQKVKYDLVAADAATNSSKVPPNIYLQSLSLAIRFDVRYSQYCVMIQQKYDLAKKVLQDTRKLINRTLYISPQLKFYCEFLLGLACTRIFIDEVLQFQGQYSGLRKYKQSLADHIPFDSFALGEFLIELPNFSS